MNYSKLDGQLASNLGQPPFKNPGVPRSVFVMVSEPLNSLNRATLEGFGVNVTGAKGTIFTGDLLPSAIETLTEQSWVVQVALSTKLRLAELELV